MPELKKITKAELASHKNRRSAWIAIHGRVYDVTSYLDTHPGGPEVMLSHAGKDVSEDFEDIGHSSGARDIAIEKEIGILEGSEVTSGAIGLPTKEAGAAAGGGSNLNIIPIVIVVFLAIATAAILFSKGSMSK
eukprot:Platyproteum_vivax@DN6591_c0_g1_i1.p1